MAAIYTTRKKDEELGVAEGAKKLAESLNAAAAKCIAIADDDATAYAALQARFARPLRTANQCTGIRISVWDARPLHLSSAPPSSPQRAAVEPSLQSLQRRG